MRGGPLDDLDGDRSYGLGVAGQRRAVVPAVGPHDPQRAERVEEPDQQEFRPGLVADRGGGDHQGQQPALAVHGQVPAPAGDLLAAVIAAGLPGDGVVGLDDLGVHDAGAGLGVPPLVRAQQLTEPADQLLRQAPVVPPFPERVRRLPGREIDREGAPLDPVLDHVGDRVAHRPQVMGHRPAHRDRQLPHYLPCPRLQHRPLRIGQVRGVDRAAVTAPAARRHAAQGGVPGRGKVNRHQDPWHRRRLDTSPLPGVPAMPPAPRRV